MKELRFLMLGLVICLASGVKAQDGVYVYIEAGCSIDYPDSNPDPSYIWAIIVENEKAYYSWRFKANSCIGSNIKMIAKAYKEGRIRPSILNDGNAHIYTYSNQKSSYNKKVYAEHHPESTYWDVYIGMPVKRPAYDDLMEFTTDMNTLVVDKKTYQRVSESELSKLTKPTTFYE